MCAVCGPQLFSSLSAPSPLLTRLCSLDFIQALQDRALLFLSAGLLKRHIPRPELRPPREAPAATHNDSITFAPLPHVLREYMRRS